MCNNSKYCLVSGQTLNDQGGFSFFLLHLWSKYTLAQCADHFKVSTQIGEKVQKNTKLEGKGLESLKIDNDYSQSI